MEIEGKDQTEPENTDIERFPEFMANFYDRKLIGTENLTMTDALEAKRIEWAETSVGLKT